MGSPGKKSSLEKYTLTEQTEAFLQLEGIEFLQKLNKFRKGGVVFGPVVRDQSHDLTKKFRKLGLKTALSAKAKEGRLASW